MANGGSLTARVCVTKWLGVYKLSQHCLANVGSRQGDADAVKIACHSPGSPREVAQVAMTQHCPFLGCWDRKSPISNSPVCVLDGIFVLRCSEH